MGIERIGGTQTDNHISVSVSIVDGYAFLEVEKSDGMYIDVALSKENLHQLEALCRRAKRRELKL